MGWKVVQSSDVLSRLLGLYSWHRFKSTALFVVVCAKNDHQSVCIAASRLTNTNLAFWPFTRSAWTKHLTTVCTIRRMKSWYLKSDRNGLTSRKIPTWQVFWLCIEQQCAKLTRFTIRAHSRLLFQRRSIRCIQEKARTWQRRRRRRVRGECQLI